jgi:mitogen-activated protein kinase kinase kinase
MSLILFKFGVFSSETVRSPYELNHTLNNYRLALVPMIETEETMELIRSEKDIIDYGRILNDYEIELLGKSKAEQANQRIYLLRTNSRKRLVKSPLITPPESPAIPVKPKALKYFGERPTSELISSNLQDYFPNLQGKYKGKLKPLADTLQSRFTVDEDEKRNTVIRIGESLETGTRPERPKTPTLVINTSNDALFSDSTSASSSLPSPVNITQSFSELNLQQLIQLAKVGESASIRHRKKRAPSVETSVSVVETPSTFLQPDMFKRRPSTASLYSDDSVSSNAVEKWVKGKLIGKGSFGSVYLGLNTSDGSLMAVKQVELPGSSDNQTNERRTKMVDALEREIDLLKEFQHPNIVSYLDSQVDDKHFNIFLEYIPGGSVAGLLSQYGALEENLIKTFTRQIMMALVYLHQKGIIHRDIKAGNILVDNKGVAKISDFGISKKTSATSKESKKSGLQGSVRKKGINDFRYFGWPLK